MAAKNVRQYTNRDACFLDRPASPSTASCSSSESPSSTSRLLPAMITVTIQCGPPRRPVTTQTGPLTYRYPIPQKNITYKNDNNKWGTTIQHRHTQTYKFTSWACKKVDEAALTGFHTYRTKFSGGVFRQREMIRHGTGWGWKEEKNEQEKLFRRV